MIVAVLGAVALVVGLAGATVLTAGLVDTAAARSLGSQGSGGGPPVAAGADAESDATETGVSFLDSVARFFGYSPGTPDAVASEDDGTLSRERRWRIELIEPPPFPSPESIRAAKRWIAGRQGYLALAVVDSEGKLHGWHADRDFISGSVTKAMLLVEYLRTHGEIEPGMEAVLGKMIRESDNDAGDTVFFAVGGDAGLRDVAARAGMRRFVADRGYWGYATIAAADQARFFFSMEKLIPKRHRRLARRLLSGVVEWQSYGVPAVARPEWKVYFKGGWRTGLRGGRLLHQAARLERDDTVFSVAILMDGVPGTAYGMKTLEGVAKRLLKE